MNNVLAKDGSYLPLDELQHTFGYVNGVLTTDTVVFAGNTYVQTLTYTTSNLTGVSAWVKQ